MKNLFFALLAVLFSSALFAQKGKIKDNDPPIITGISIEDGYVIQYGQTTLYPVYLDAVDNSEIFQKVYQVDPCGPTYPAGPQMGKNCSYSSATDLWEVNQYYLSIQGLQRGPHILRYTVYDRERNETSEEITFYIQ